MDKDRDNKGHGGGENGQGGNGGNGQGGGNPGPGDGQDHNDRDKVTIVVNGRSKKWEKDQISYDELVALSGLQPPTGPNPGFTITYHNGPDHRDGTVVPGQSVKVRNGMVFNVTPTNQS